MNDIDRALLESRKMVKELTYQLAIIREATVGGLEELPGYHKQIKMYYDNFFKNLKKNLETFKNFYNDIVNKYNAGIETSLDLYRSIERQTLKACETFANMMYIYKVITKNEKRPMPEYGMKLINDAAERLKLIIDRLRKIFMWYAPHVIVDGHDKKPINKRENTYYTLVNFVNMIGVKIQDIYTK